MRRHDRGADPGSDLIRTIEIKNRDGQVVERKEVVTCKGLLHLAHGERLSNVRSRLVQLPTKENGETAIVLVRVSTSRGVFSGIGDANPRNVNARIAPAFIRMAETRALARALRAALDVGAVAIEELEEELSFAERERPAQRAPTNGQHAEPEPDERAPERRPNGHGSPDTSPRTNGGGYDRGVSPGPDAPMSDAQKRLLFRIAFERGHEGDRARAWLHTELGVDSLGKVSRRAASAFIDRQKSNGNGRASGDNGHAAAS
jgi:hypothetical protein